MNRRNCGSGLRNSGKDGGGVSKELDFCLFVTLRVDLQDIYLQYSFYNCDGSTGISGASIAVLLALEGEQIGEFISCVRM